MILVQCSDLDRQALTGVKYNSEDLKPDSFDWYEVRVTKPWGHEIERYRTQDCSVTWLHIHSNQSTSMHCHLTKTVMICVMGGESVLETLNDSHKLESGMLAVIEPGAFHRMKANGNPVVLYEIETPRNKRDLIRLDDDYGRGQGYETAIQLETK